MSLAVGSRRGPFEIVALLGAGGMGEVYRARDTRLNRDVAIKVLLPAVANDPDRLARFSREAQVLASLNHPHIAQVHGLEESEGVRALVMELIEGPTLADRIAQGAIALDDALPIARQIAEAVEAAHEQGIIHRDLKPANIKVRADGIVKVLDFGLAKALDSVGASGGNATVSPTLSIHATQAGVILGTAAYMAPEQARGKAVDKRADIWAFGCVLFEMLAGARAFRSDDVTDTIVAVVSKEPDWQALPVAASGVRPLLARCLKKDPKQRLQAIGDARIQIEELISGMSSEAGMPSRPVVTPSRRVALPAIGVLAGGVLLGAVVMWAVARRAPQAPVLSSRFEITPPPTQPLAIQGADRDIAISPDSRHIVYRSGASLAPLVVRAIDRLDANPLAGVINARQPFFSSDSQWVGFFEGGSLKKVSITRGSAITICQNNAQPRGASWGDDNSIVFATTDSTNGLVRVSASGGEPTVLTRPDPAKGETNHWYPSVLPGGRGVLYTITGPNQAESAQVAVLDLKTGQQKTLIRGGSQAEYVQSGHLLYAAAGMLLAVRFDLATLAVLSDPVPAVDDVRMTMGGAAEYAVSRSGTLAYVSATPSRAQRSLVWVDRKGREAPISAPPRVYAQPRLSPDGTRVALAIRDQEMDIWIWDLSRETLTRLTFDPGIDQRPVWTPDGQRIVFASQHDGVFNLFAQAADGTGTVERLTASPNSQAPAFVAPDGSGIMGVEISPNTVSDIAWFPLASHLSGSGLRAASGSSRSPVEPLIRTTASEQNPEISPDGRYIAYQSNETGRDEIYVRPFPRVTDGRWQVTTGGGTRPAWARNGGELFYLDLANTLTAVRVRTSGVTFAAGNPTKVFDATFARPLNDPRTYDVSPDGQRFLMIKENVAANQNTTRAGIVVVLNWFEELKAKVPAGK
jgi:serine/threonine protein kinase/Tol biopolymer transport system component